MSDKHAGRGRDRQRHIPTGDRPLLLVDRGPDAFDEGVWEADIDDPHIDGGQWTGKFYIRGGKAWSWCTDGEDSEGQENANVRAIAHRMTHWRELCELLERDERILDAVLPLVQAAIVERTAELGGRPVATAKATRARAVAAISSKIRQLITVREVAVEEKRR